MEIFNKENYGENFFRPKLINFLKANTDTRNILASACRKNKEFE